MPLKLPRKVRRSPDGRYHILPLYTIPLGLLYQKILRPHLSIIGTELSGFFREEISFICAGIL